MKKPSIGIILSTTRKGRFGDIPAAWASQIALGRDDLSFEIIDFRDYSLPMFDDPLPPSRGPSTKEAVTRWLERVCSFDGYMFITAEYNHGIPAVLKNALDYCYSELGKKPALYLGYGGLGAARAIEQLRLICIELGMAPMKNAVHIGVEPYLAVSKGEKELFEFDHLNSEMQRALNELSWWTYALQRAREV